MPAIPGIALAGVATLRDLEDLETLDKLAVAGRRAVVLGGGNVGLQACEALVERGLKVTVVVASAHLLSQMVDAEAGRRVGELLGEPRDRRAHWPRCRRDVGRDSVEAVLLDNGERVAADLVVVGKGILPNIEWLRDSAFASGRGVVGGPAGEPTSRASSPPEIAPKAADPLDGPPVAQRRLAGGVRNGPRGR